MSDFYHGKSDIEVARFINLALLMCNGIKQQDAGFDYVTTITDGGLNRIADIIRAVRRAEIVGIKDDRSAQVRQNEIEHNEVWNAAIEASAKIADGADEIAASDIRKLKK